MYLWKCWRDSSPWFFACLILLLPFVLLTMKGRGPNSAPPGDALLAIVEAWRELGFLTVLTACLFGAATAVTKSISGGSGDFLLTRPRSRRYFIWIGWAVGVAQVFALVTSTALLVVAFLYQEDGPFWRHLPATTVINQQAMTVDIPLLLASIFVIAVSAYSATYFMAVLTHGRSPMLVFLAFFLYQSARRAGSAGSHLPALLVQPYYEASPRQLAVGNQSAIYALVAWGVCALACMIAAQWVFERAEI